MKMNKSNCKYKITKLFNSNHTNEQNGPGLVHTFCLHKTVLTNSAGTYYKDAGQIVFAWARWIMSSQVDGQTLLQALKHIQCTVCLPPNNPQVQECLLKIQQKLTIS